MKAENIVVSGVKVVQVLRESLGAKNPSGVPVLEWRDFTWDGVPWVLEQDRNPGFFTLWDMTKGATGLPVGVANADFASVFYDDHTLMCILPATRGHRVYRDSDARFTPYDGSTYSTYKIPKHAIENGNIKSLSVSDYFGRLTPISATHQDAMLAIMYQMLLFCQEEARALGSIESARLKRIRNSLRL